MIVQILNMYHPDGEKILNRHAKVKKFAEYNEAEIIAYLQDHPDVKAILLRAPAKITPAILDQCHHVTVISGSGVGLDNIDVDYATKKGIAVLHAPKINSQATAEHAIGLLLAVMKKTVLLDTETRKGNYSIRNGKYTYELKNKTLGLVGFGSIAQKVAKIATNGFDMKVFAYVRTITDEKQQLAKQLHIELTTELESVFRESDAVSLHIPLTKETDQLIDQKYFSLMKKSAVLINTARGGIIKEADLVSALKNGQILGAGIDVFSDEPPPKDHPFFQLNQVTVSPHIGGISIEAAKKTSVIIAENLIRVMNGEDLPVIANRQVIL
ncbi:hydroxyacid dehydrogenase [Bacillaceae bacterium Marseille-Q3522]|nr:hydroxyacid dehydrogenase [Bacillaceae bacterium Marseille-Q3522]